MWPRCALTGEGAIQVYSIRVTGMKRCADWLRYFRNHCQQAPLLARSKYQANKCPVSAALQICTEIVDFWMILCSDLCRGYTPSMDGLVPVCRVQMLGFALFGSLLVSFNGVLNCIWDEWEWRNGGTERGTGVLVLTEGLECWYWQGDWSTGGETLYSVCGRWMNGYGAMVEWCWQGKTEVLGEKKIVQRGW